MARLLTYFGYNVFSVTTKDYISVFVPLSPKEIPKDRLEETIRGWLNPELLWARGYLSLEDAVCSQEQWQGCERFPHTESLRVVVELQVPLWLVQLQDDEVKVNLDGYGWIRVTNLYITAKCAPGFFEREALPGDLPFNGSVYEVIALT